MSTLAKLKAVNLDKIDNSTLKDLVKKNIEQFNEEKATEKGRAQLDQIYSLIERKYPDAIKVEEKPTEKKKIGDKSANPENDIAGLTKVDETHYKFNDYGNDIAYIIKSLKNDYGINVKKTDSVMQNDDSINYTLEVVGEKDNAKGDEKKHYLTKVFLHWSEGAYHEHDKKEISMEDLQHVAERIFEPGAGYSKMKIGFTWDDGKEITDRVDVGAGGGDFNPNEQNIKDYMTKTVAESGVMYTSSLQAGDVSQGKYLFEFAPGTKKESKPKKEKKVKKAKAKVIDLKPTSEEPLDVQLKKISGYGFHSDDWENEQKSDHLKPSGVLINKHNGIRVRVQEKASFTESKTETKSEQEPGKDTTTDLGNTLRKVSESEYILTSKHDAKKVAAITKDKDGMFTSDCCDKKDEVLYKTAELAIYHTELVWDASTRIQKAKEAAKARRTNEKEREAKGLPTRKSIMEKAESLKKTIDTRSKKMPEGDAKKVEKVGSKTVAEMKTIKSAKKFADGGNINNPIAVFQEKNNDGKFVGNKIYYYETKNPKWWFVSVGKEKEGSIPEYGSGSGEWRSKKDYPTVKALEEYHKHDSIYKVEEFAKGGKIKPKDITKELEAFDIDDLDPFEERMYKHHVDEAKMSKAEALQVIINDVEGDYSQLSPELEAIAEKQMSRSQMDKISQKELGYAKGGKVFSKYTVYHTPSQSEITFGKDDVVKDIREYKGKHKKEINVNGTIYRQNKVYKTYNSVMGNEVLTKAQFKNYTF